MKIEIDFNNLSDVIETLYSYDMNREEYGELATLEGVLAAIKEANEELAEGGGGKITFVK